MNHASEFPELEVRAICRDRGVEIIGSTDRTYLAGSMKSPDALHVHPSDLGWLNAHQLLTNEPDVSVTLHAEGMEGAEFRFILAETPEHVVSVSFE